VSGKNPTEWGGVTQPIVRAQPELWVSVAIHPSPKTSIPSRRVRSAHPPGGDFVYIMETVVQNTHGSLRFTMGSVTSPRSAGFPLCRGICIAPPPGGDLEYILKLLSIIPMFRFASPWALLLHPAPRGFLSRPGTRAVNNSIKH